MTPPRLPAPHLGGLAIVEAHIVEADFARTHDERPAVRPVDGGNDPHAIFDQFYCSMRVKQFGRLGKLDFLAFVGRLDLAPITPGSAYLEKATGPLAGARLFELDPRRLDAWLM